MMQSVPANAFRKLFDQFFESMIPENLEWFAELDDAAIIYADRVANELSTLAEAIDYKDHPPTGTKLAEILHKLSDDARMISALVYVASNSNLKLNETKVGAVRHE